MVRLHTLSVAVALTVSLVAVTSEADTITLGLYRLGDDDPGAVAGALGNNPTIASVGTDATRYNSPTYSANTPGPLSSLSMYFDGPSNDHYRSSVYNLGADNWGMEAWVYSDSASNNGWAFSNGRYLIGQFSGTFKWHRNGQGDVANATLLTDGWHHMALVRDGGTLKAYLDGDYVPSTNRTDSWDWGFAVGATPAGAETWFGMVDHVRLFTFEPGSFDPATHLTLSLIPEPSGAVLAAFAVLGVMVFGWRRRR